MSFLVKQATSSLQGCGNSRALRQGCVKAAMEKAIAAGQLPNADLPAFTLEVPRRPGPWRLGRATPPWPAPGRSTRRRAKLPKPFAKTWTCPARILTAAKSPAPVF